MACGGLAGEESDCNWSGNPAGCSKRSFSKAAASEGLRTYIPHFVSAVRPRMNLGERRNPFNHSDLQESFQYIEGLIEARTLHGKRRVLARQGRVGEKSDFSASCQWASVSWITATLVNIKAAEGSVGVIAGTANGRCSWFMYVLEAQRTFWLR